MPNNLLIRDYSGTSGMSGSLLFLNSKVCCINIGGAIKYQYKIGQIIGCARADMWIEAIQILDQVNRELLSDQHFDFSKLIVNLDLLRFLCLQKRFELIVQFAAELMQELVIAFDSRLELDHNVAVSCFHPIMQDVKRVCINFKLCQIKDIHNTEDL